MDIRAGVMVGSDSSKSYGCESSQLKLYEQVFTLASVKTLSNRPEGEKNSDHHDTVVSSPGYCSLFNTSNGSENRNSALTALPQKH